MAGLVFGFLNINNTNQFVTRLDIRVNYTDHINREQTFNDFKMIFLEQDNYDEWLNDNPEALLKFDEISSFNVLNGVKIMKDFNLIEWDENFVRLHLDKNDVYFVNSIRQYLLFSSSALTSRYLDKAKNEKENIKNLFNNTKQEVNVTNEYFKELIKLDRFISNISNGNSLISIDYPRPIEKKGSGNKFKIFKSLVIFILGGLIFISLKNLYKVYKSSRQNNK